MSRLTTIESGKSVILLYIDGGYGSQKKLLDMGLIPGESIKIINNSGLGSLTVNIKGSRLALGRGLAEKIFVKER